MYFYPSKPPIAYTPSASTAAASALRGWIIAGKQTHFYVFV